MIELKRPFAEDYISKMTDAELRRKKSLQSKLAIATSTTGLSSLGLVTAGGIARKKPSIVADGTKAIFRSTKKYKPITPKEIEAQNKADELATSLKDKGYAIGAVGSGIGGFGGFNFAAIQRAESQRRQKAKKPIAKYYNAYTGTQTTHYSPKTAFASPDPEKRRESRAKVYTPALAAGGVGAIVGRNKIGQTAEKATVGTKNWSRGKVLEPLQTARSAAYANVPADAAAKLQDVQNKRDFADRAERRAQRAADPKQAKVHRKNAANARKEADTIEKPIKEAKDAFKSADNALNTGYRENKITRAAPKAYKRGKIGAVVGGAGLLGLAAGNEIHRRKGGKPFKGHFDKYKP